MEEYLELVRVKVNQIQDFLNRLQQTIGLSSSTDDSIYGKINALTTMIQNAKVPTYHTEVLSVNNNKFVCSFEPKNGICLNNEVTIYHPDGGTLIWEGITFNGNIGELDDANFSYDGWDIKIQYFYDSSLI